MTTQSISSAPATKAFDIAAIRKDFPILQTVTSTGKPLVYLDNGATTQKPRGVIEAIVRYYESQNANIHRGVYELSQTATALYEEVREKVRVFLNAKEGAECIFTRGTTEGINLVAASWGRTNLKARDEVLVSGLEHHSNIVPWQMICEAVGARVVPIPVKDDGDLDIARYEESLKSGRVKLVAVNHVSNSLGTVNPVAAMIRAAHSVGALVLVDGAQWVAHGKTDVQAIDADFYAFSGHKLFGPTGIGVVYGKRALLEAMAPYQGGGDMIASVRFEKTEYAELPNKFEAGTPDIAGVVGLGAAIDYVNGIGFEAIHVAEADLLAYATKRIAEVPGVRVIGTAPHKAAVLSFVMDGSGGGPVVSTLDIGRKLDRDGICVRTGHHCCQPVMERFGVSSTARASFAFYNTHAEVDALIEGLKKIVVTESRSVSSTPPVASSPVVRNKHARSELETIAFPSALAPSVRKAAQELVDAFEFLGDWEQRDQFILDLGNKLLPLPAELKNEATRVHGCQSVVHLISRQKPERAAEPLLEFLADSDAHIVRGLIGVLQKLYSGQPAKQILAFDINGFIEKLGLDQHLSMTRRNGLAGMIQRIRENAKTMVERNAAVVETK